MASKPKRRRLEPAARYQEIIKVASMLIAQSGYYGVSLQKVADGCGMTKAGLLHYFASKDVLLIAVLIARDKADIQAINKTSPAQPIDKIETRKLLDNLVERNAKQREIVRLFTILNAESLNANHPAHEYFSTRTADIKANFQTNISGWHPDPKSFTNIIFSFLDGLQLMWLRDEKVDLVDEWHNFANLIFE